MRMDASFFGDNHLNFFFFAPWHCREYFRSTIKTKKNFFVLYCAHLFVPLILRILGTPVRK